MSDLFVVVVMVLVAVLLCGMLVLGVGHNLRRVPPEPADGADGVAAPELPSERMPSLAILQTGAADRVAPSPPPSPAAGIPQFDERVQPGSDQRSPRPSRRFKPRTGAPAGSPPDAAREWAAEIAWRNVDGGPRFLAYARSDDGPEVVILSSDAVEWPPRGDDAVAGLEQIVRGLKAQLLGVGWMAAEAGEAWYAERFVWAPRDSVPDPGRDELVTGRPRRKRASLRPTGDQ